METVIRAARSEDASEILAFIKELASYERAPGAVKATEADILAHGFGEKRYFHTLLAEVDGEVVGFALYFFTYSTWEGRPSLYVEEIFVRPAFRGRGMGKALMVACAREALGRDCMRMQWQVVDWNEPAIDFYRVLGGYQTGQWLPFRMDREAMEALARQCQEGQ